MPMTDTYTAEARAKAVTRITALLQKTVAKGCTPEEESAAGHMADRLMAKYGISAGECRPRERRTISFDDIFREYQAQRPSPNRDEGARRRQARAQYHANGVHLDGASFDEGCVCSDCFGRRYGFGASTSRGSQAHADFTGGSYDYMRDEPSRGRGGSQAKTGRKNGSHAGCDHDATSAARARCRRQRAAQGA